MTSKLDADPRVDPRIKALLGAMPTANPGDAESREQLLDEASSEAAVAARKALTAFMTMCDDEKVAPSAGLEVATHEFKSSPDGNTIKLQLIRPEAETALPCVYYIHGGGMQSMSCFDGMYKAWGRIIAAQVSATAANSSQC